MASLTAPQLTHKTPVSLPATASLGAAADTTNGDTVPNGGTTFLFMNNTAGTSGTVTIVTTSEVDDQAVEDLQFTVPANTVQLVKLGPTSVYGTSTTINCSANTIRLLAYSI